MVSISWSNSSCRYLFNVLSSYLCIALFLVFHILCVIFCRRMESFISHTFVLFLLNMRRKNISCSVAHPLVHIPFSVARWSSCNCPFIVLSCSLSSFISIMVPSRRCWIVVFTMVLIAMLVVAEG